MQHANSQLRRLHFRAEMEEASNKRMFLDLKLFSELKVEMHLMSQIKHMEVKVVKSIKTKLSRKNEDLHCLIKSHNR